MNHIFYLPLVTRTEFYNHVTPHDKYFNNFNATIDDGEKKFLGELHGQGGEYGVLYITGHGGLNTTLSLREPLDARVISPDQLGAHLLGKIDVNLPDFLQQYQGIRLLSHRIRKVKVFACFSGVAPDDGISSFAHELAVYFRVNHCHVPVYGYTGLTKFEGGRKYIDGGFGVQPKRAKSRRAKFCQHNPNEKFTLTQEARQDWQDGDNWWVFDKASIEKWRQG
ncbi:hypothetical protein FKG94_18090 [Exilibacterium tricleocarpae]|uniref:Uncharacterized protein n=1 Tax=Exilibacterium tricleocarpae TaxID=2591008 RepID=A0A545T5Z8_9GAMM|nr:hypothetical protein [Exilibacterium tricleocarpae]TQV72608.1 hypothetical protein FKG94_18090 [Exilibacterium tricleocarpae]